MTRVTLKEGHSLTEWRSCLEVGVASWRGRGTISCCVCTAESATRAKKVFDGILKSKMRADTTRNALSVLQRYRFLFSLPKNIEKNIKNVS